MAASPDSLDAASVTIFQEYLRINTMQPNPDYDSAVKFLLRVGEEIGLKCFTVSPVANKPFVIMTLIGSDPTLPSLLLSSHMDVVPVFPEHWKYDPFSAHKEENGDIYARGSQDMKCVGIQYIEAIRRLLKQGHKFLRTIHVIFTADEETPTPGNMKNFITTSHFKELNVGFALDEGIASPTHVAKLFYAERSCWWVRVICEGNPGHGSMFIEGTAAEKLQKIINNFLSWREVEKQKLADNPCLKLGDVTSINMNIIKGGVQGNVVPAEMYAQFDIRIPPTEDLVALKQKIQNWCDEAGSGVRYEFHESNFDQTITPHDDTFPWWTAFNKGCQEGKMKIEPGIFPAGTDARHLRAVGYHGYGFSPMINTPVLLHDHNEFLNEGVFLNGIQVYTHIITNMANVPAL